MDTWHQSPGEVGSRTLKVGLMLPVVVTEALGMLGTCISYTEAKSDKWGKNVCLTLFKSTVVSHLKDRATF